MHIKKCIVFASLLLALFSARADNNFMQGLGERFKIEPSDSGYLANQFQFDIFGSAVNSGSILGRDSSSIGGGSLPWKPKTITSSDSVSGSGSNYTQPRRSHRAQRPGTSDS